MSRQYYFAEGYLLEDRSRPNRQSSWIVLFNPTSREAKLRFTFYYTDGEPTARDFAVPPRMGMSAHLLEWKEIKVDARFGARIESSEPIVAQLTTAYYGAEDRDDMYTRAMHSVICADRLSTVNYYADAFVIDRPNQRLKEPEWAFLLNPNDQPAKVRLHAFRSDGEKRTYDFSVGARRVLPVFMDETVEKNVLFGATWVSSVPIAIQQTRLVDEMDRKTIRACFSVMAKPGPLAWQDDLEVGV
jgi:hypothetical protein